MKTLKLVAICSALASSAAFSATAVKTPIIVSSSGGGHMPREWSFYKTCEVFADKIVVTSRFASGEIITKEEHPISIAGTTKLAAIILKAETEGVDSTENSMCDGPTSGIYGNKIAQNGSVEQVTLFSSGGCGSPRLERSGPYAFILKNIIGTYCPEAITGPQAP
ncbi:MAG: hypothetical protein NTV34_11280 [Proteobacteria bacterium]|nr:hypothetical protein [Pseudomonadota bacterium]